MTTFGTPLKLFSADSLWNSYPVKPVLGTYQIPKSDYFPTVQGGAWSTGLFVAKATDGPMTVNGLGGAAGVKDPDSCVDRPVTIPRWPASTLPATGSDGRADIYDPVTDIVHSFWQLKNVNGKWQAALYAFSPAKGHGWGDPAHFYHGARATGVPATAGLIRAHEINDGQATYKHALAMSLTYNALSATTPYIAPATSADWDAAHTNTGQIPQGALLMLPANYDTSKIANLALRKVADTLKTYGAYVVDRNTGTPFAIYVENGATFNLHGAGWNSAVGDELDRIRASLRQVVSHSGFINGDGAPRVAPSRQNILSMRGPWRNCTTSKTEEIYDSLNQRAQLPVVTAWTRWLNATGSGFALKEFKPKAGEYFKFVVDSNCGATFNVVLKRMVEGKVVTAYDSGLRAHNSLTYFQWPAGAWSELYVSKSAGSPAGYIRPRIVKIGEAEYNAAPKG